MRLAIVDGSRSQATVLKALLTSEGHEIEIFPDGDACLCTLTHRSFDCFVIEWALPSIDGKEVLRRIRDHVGWKPFIIICAGNANEEDAADVLRLGADDFVLKPLRYMEFMARIHALSRRFGNPLSVQSRFGDFELKDQERRILRSGKAIELTQTEFDLAFLFFSNVSRLYSREELLMQIWSQHSDIDTRTVDTHTSRIRKKLGLDGQHGYILSSVYGVGYRLDSVR